MKMKAAGLRPEETKVPSRGAGGSCHSPRQPAVWLKGEQGCAPFTWWAQWGPGRCWHIDGPPHSKLFPQQQLAQLCSSLQLPEASLSHCPASKLAARCRCLPKCPSLVKRGGGRDLKGSDAPVSDGAPHPLLQTQDVPTFQPPSWPGFLANSGKEGRRDCPRSLIFTLGWSPLPPPKGQARPSSAGQ